MIYACQVNNPNSNSGAGSDYIEFKYNGNTYKIDESQSYLNNCVANKESKSTTFPFLYTNSLSFNSIGTGNPIQMIILATYDTSSLSTKAYSFSQQKAWLNVSFIDFSSVNTLTQTDSISGNVLITHAGHAKGEKIEGTFTIDDVKKFDSGGHLLSDKHDITDGKFRITIE